METAKVKVKVWVEFTIKVPEGKTRDEALDMLEEQEIEDAIESAVEAGGITYWERPRWV